ncbi:MAG: hypothetical protein IIB22_11355 [Chloroflexi bacterium]|nr:hypothetical protein [Chloroflexota bacterium]
MEDAVAASPEAPEQRDPLKFDAWAVDTLVERLRTDLGLTPIKAAIAGVVSVTIALLVIGIVIFALGIDSLDINYVKPDREIFLHPASNKTELTGLSLGIVGVLAWASIPAFYVWVSSASGELFEKMSGSDLFEDDEDAPLTGLARALHMWDSWAVIPWGFLAFLVLSMATGPFYAIEREWVFVAWAPLISVMVVVIYLSLMIFVRLLITSLALRQIFRSHKMSVAPFHPDRCGGLGDLWYFISRSGAFLLVAGLSIACLTADQALIGGLPLGWSSISIMAAFVIFITVVGYNAIWSARSTMLTAKRSHLDNITTRINAYYSVSIGDVSSGADVDSKNIEALLKLRDIHNFVSDLAEWPLDSRWVNRFTASVAVLLSPASLAFAVLRLVLR